MPELTKPEALILERLFTEQIKPGSLGLAQVENATVRRLVGRGFAERAEVTLPGRLPVLVRGYQLTLAGHQAYCSWAAENCPDQPDPAT